MTTSETKISYWLQISKILEYTTFRGQGPNHTSCQNHTCDPSPKLHSEPSFIHLLTFMMPFQNWEPRLELCWKTPPFCIYFLLRRSTHKILSEDSIFISHLSSKAEFKTLVSVKPIPPKSLGRAGSAHLTMWYFLPCLLPARGRPKILRWGIQNKKGEIFYTQKS